MDVGDVDRSDIIMVEKDRQVIVTCCCGIVVVLRQRLRLCDDIVRLQMNEAMMRRFLFRFRESREFFSLTASKKKGVVVSGV